MALITNPIEAKIFVPYLTSADGNGRTGRLILFRECLKNKIVPVVIEDANRNEYLEALKEYRETERLNKMIELFKREQQFYLKKSKYFM